MSEDQTVPAVAKSKKKTKKTSTPRAPRVIDPAILAIRKRAAEQIEEHRKQAGSAAIVERIVKKDLPRLAVADLDSLRTTITGMIQKTTFDGTAAHALPGA